MLVGQSRARASETSCRCPELKFEPSLALAAGTLSISQSTAINFPTTLQSQRESGAALFRCGSRLCSADQSSNLVT
jgi:D-serine deaminase-like pyridoxal phosphate-dependent protein